MHYPIYIPMFPSLKIVEFKGTNNSNYELFICWRVLYLPFLEFVVLLENKNKKLRERERERL